MYSEAELKRREALAEGDGPEAAEILYDLGYEYLERRDIYKAAETFQKAIDKGRDAYRILADIYEFDKRNFPGASPEKAFNLYKTRVGLNIEPKPMLSTLRLGFMYCEGKGTERNLMEGMRLIGKALSDIEKSIANGDGDFAPEEYNRLGWIYYKGLSNLDGTDIQTSREIEKAIEYWERAVSLCTERHSGLKGLILEAIAVAKKRLTLWRS